MADDTVRAPAGPAGLPPELSALAAYLEVDRKPAAIVRVISNAVTPQKNEEPVYWNGSWKRLQDPRKEITDLHAAVQQTLESSSHISVLHGRTIGNGRWESRIWGDYCIAVAEEGASSLKVAEDKKQTTNGHMQPCLDWTQCATPSMSPWQQYIRSVDWASTNFGPMRDWPPLLRQQVVIIMANPNPRLIIWGPKMSLIYNEACVQLFGKDHPEAMGHDAIDPHSHSWHTLRPLVEEGYRGQSLQQQNLYLEIQRCGHTQETYWDATVLPIADHFGQSVGVLTELSEVTLVVTGERRRHALGTLSNHIAGALTLSELWTAVLKGLQADEIDVPYALLYDVVDVERSTSGPDAADSPVADIAPKKGVLVGTVGIQESQLDGCRAFVLADLGSASNGIVKACRRAFHNRTSHSLSTKDGTLPPVLACSVPGRSFGDVVSEALVLPIHSTTSGEVLGIAIIGVYPRAGMDAEYKIWLQIMSDFVEKAASLISLPEAQRRAKKIADDMVTSLAHKLRFMTLQAERNEAKFARLAATAPTGMFMFSPDGKVLYVNDTYLDMLGEPRDEFRSTRAESSHWTDRIHDDDKERFVQAWRKAIDEKTPLVLEHRLKRPWKSIDKSTGQEILGETWLLATAFPELAADGTVIAIQGWLTEISHRKFSENLLAQRLKDALENKRQTENFIDMTSHEMRNPLSAILQSADSILTILGSDSLDDLEVAPPLQYQLVEDIVDAAQTIILCAQHQKRIVDDVLTLSKLDANLLEISPERVRLPLLVEKALKMYEAELERADIQTSLCLEPTYHELKVDWVILDPSRLLQVIINLLTNSIKFTRNAEQRKIKICIGASYEKPTGKHHKVSFIPPQPSRRPKSPTADDSPGEDIYLQIGVYDTGRGLTDDEIKVLFQRFQQGSPKTYKQYGGSGLGLFISRELCELQGGQIGVASQGGKTVFTFFVKARRWVPDRAKETLVGAALPRFASASASPMIYSKQSSVLLNEATNQLSMQVAEDGTLEHDFQPLTLQRTISRIKKTPSIPSSLRDEARTPTTPVSKDAMHVLIVEDNVINQKVLSQQLKRAGCIVHVANHGLECLDFLDRSTYCADPVSGDAVTTTTTTGDKPAATPLSIILLDLEMPTMDGLTCVRHIRARQLAGRIRSHVPVIAVTANARSEQITTAIEAGMDSVVTKPFRIPELVPQMEKLVAETALALVGAS